MAEAYKCDRCSKYYGTNNKRKHQWEVNKLRQPTTGTKRHEQHLCESCRDDLEKFMNCELTTDDVRTSSFPAINTEKIEYVRGQKHPTERNSWIPFEDRNIRFTLSFGDKDTDLNFQRDNGGRNY